jgi:uncharacterized protein (TIGR03000 family)
MAQDGAPQPITITVQVPADAQVAFDGFRTRSGGESRRYETPPLAAGRDHTYTLTVTSQGKTITRNITVRPGADNTFDLRVASAAQGGNDGPVPEDKQAVTSKPTPRTAASSVNFRKELNLPFDSLSTLGTRIESARRKPDPVALVHAANELAVAEKVSGKTASITSQQVAQEAAELAAMRRQEKELQAVLQVSEQMAVQERNISLMQDSLAAARAQIQADKEAVAQNQEPTWKPSQVVVNNYTTQYLDIYVNGYYKVQVAPGMQQTFAIEHRWNPTVLKAYGNEDINTWGPRYIWGRFTKYTWNIE